MSEATLQTKNTTAMDTPQHWHDAPMYEPPVSKEEIARAQKEIDSIVGTTRDNKPIIKLVWNGDTSFWESFYQEWTLTGKPIEKSVRKRPFALYATKRDDNNRVVQDIFPPRFVLLTRIEPEQYADTWKFDAMVYDPVINAQKPIRPVDPPKDWYLWFQTIAEHEDGCCQVAMQDNRKCYGAYAPPAQCFEGLREIQKGMKATGLKDNDPFATPDAVMRRTARNAQNNYERQAMHEKVAAAAAMNANPLALVSPQVVKDMGRQKIIEGVREATKKMLNTEDKK